MVFTLRGNWQNRAIADIKEGPLELVHKSVSDIRWASACSLLDLGHSKLSITQIDNSVAHEITALEVVADC